MPGGRKRGRPRNGATPAATNVADADAARKEPRKAPHRTPQTPMEMAAEDRVYKVDRITSMRWTKGMREYRVLWENYEEKDSTWEPMEHLVGCAAQIREFEQRREAEDQKAKEDVLKKRREKQAKKAADAQALTDAAAASIVDLPDGDGVKFSKRGAAAVKA